MTCPFAEVTEGYTDTLLSFQISLISRSKLLLLLLLLLLLKWDVGVWTGSSWLRIGTNGGHLSMR